MLVCYFHGLQAAKTAEAETPRGADRSAQWCDGGDCAPPSEMKVWVCRVFFDSGYFARLLMGGQITAAKHAP